MTWKDRKLVWVETDHPLDDLGQRCNDSELFSDLFDAKQLYILKERSLPEFIDGIISMSDKFTDVAIDLNIISGLALTISVLCLIPLEVQTIEDDEHASKFLELLKTENGEQFWLMEELEQYDNLDYLVDHFSELGLVKKNDGKVVLRGKVLNRVHLI